MDELLASAGRIAEKLPLPLLVPVLVAAVLFYAWQRATKEDARNAAAQSDGQLAKLTTLENSMTRIEVKVDRVANSVELLRERRT